MNETSEFIDMEREKVDETVAAIADEIKRLKALVNRLIQRNGDLRLRVADLEFQLTETTVQLARALERNDWIAVEERLPTVETPSENFLGPRVEAIVSGAAVNQEGRWYLYLASCKVTHWRPLYTPIDKS